MAERRVVIVGGGIVGLACAYFLARRGAGVTVLERETDDDGASSGNAGLVSIGHGPLPRPGLTAAAFRWMWRNDSPLYIPPRADPALFAWLWRFRRACGRAHHARSAALLAAHGHPAGACFREILEREAIDCEYRPIGEMDVYLTEAGERAVHREAEALRRRGYRAEILDGAELRRREPAFLRDVRGAVLHPERAFANPGAFIRGFAAAVECAGARIRRPCAVEALRVESGRCAGVRTADGERVDGDVTILAAGAWTSALAGAAGERIPMQPGKGYHVDLSGDVPPLRTACVGVETFVAMTPMNGGLRLAGTLEFSGINDRIVDARARALSRGAARLLEGVERAAVGPAWCGLRPCTADGLPVLGWAHRTRDLFIATGHAMMGFTLGPLAGRLAAEAILDGRTTLDVGPLDPSRLAP